MSAADTYVRVIVDVCHLLACITVVLVEWAGQWFLEKVCSFRKEVS